MYASKSACGGDDDTLMPANGVAAANDEAATISDSQHGAFEFNPAPVADLAHARAPLPTWRGGLGRAARFLWRACCAARFIATKSSRVIGLSFFGGGDRGLTVGSACTRAGSAFSPRLGAAC